MKQTPQRIVLLLTVWALASVPASAVDREPAGSMPGSPWTLEEIQGQLELYPHDAYLQYVALQLAQRKSEAEMNRMATQLRGRRMGGAGRREQVDLFSLTTGALAVQESLQLDAMAGEQTPQIDLAGRPNVNNLQKINALVEIAKAQAQVGDRDAATKTVHQAQQMADADTNLNEIQKGHAFVQFLAVQVEMGDLNAALRDANAISHLGQKANALALIASAQAEAGDRTAAARTLQQAQLAFKSARINYHQTTDTVSALSQIATAQAKLGDVKGALMTGYAIKYVSQDVTHLVEVAAALVKAGDMKGALQTAESINVSRNSSQRAEILAKIAMVQANAGDVEGALKTTNEIKAYLFRKVGPLAQVAIAQAKAGDSDAVVQTLQQAQQLTQRMAAMQKAPALAEIAEAQAMVGDKAAAAKTFQLALKATESIRSIRAFPKALALAQIATAQAKAGERAASTKTFQLAIETVGAIPGNSSPDSRPLLAGEPPQPEPADFDIAKLKGPMVRSLPFEKMLAGRQPNVSRLAAVVPEDFYYIRFRSVTKLLEVVESSDLWATHLFSQSTQQAYSHQVGERLKTQLCVESTGLLRPFYDLSVREVAIVGSDLFLREGSDVTLLFGYQQEVVFKAQMDGFLASAQKTYTDARRSTGSYRGVSFVHLATPDRSVDVFSAYPSKGLHLRSNSRVALERIIDTLKGPVKGDNPAQETPKPLAQALDFLYMRTLFEKDAAEEDGFIFLSDAFIRQLVGPVKKITERRRVLCYNHLRMLGHAALLYRTEKAADPKNLDQLFKTECLPPGFGTGRLACPDSGRYQLSADGTEGLCSVHGRSRWMSPCSDMPVTHITTTERNLYQQFLQEYNRYWRTYFDPIGIRVQLTPQTYRLETIILPLIDNSIYTAMAQTLGGTPKPLDSLPVPKRTIFSIALKFNKETLIALATRGRGILALEEMGQELLRNLGIRGVDPKKLGVADFLLKGIGEQVSFHVYDAAPTFDFSLPRFFGQTLGGSFGRQGPDQTTLLISMLVTSLNAPVYLAVPVEDEKIVDDFLDRLDLVLARVARKPTDLGFFAIKQDFYKLPQGGQSVRCFALEFFSFRFRFFTARVDNTLYIATQPFILRDLFNQAAAQPEAKPDVPPDSVAHVLVRIRPENWQRVLSTYQLGWAEANRESCLKNLGPLLGVARAYGGSGRQILGVTDQHYGVRFFCPEGGRYEVEQPEEGVPQLRGFVRCNIHGTAEDPHQLTAPAQNSRTGRLLSEFTGLTTALTFTGEGLRAVLRIDRKPVPR